MRYLFAVCLLPVLLAACVQTPTPILPTQTVQVEPSASFTPIPTFTPKVVPTPTQAAPLGTIALDFVALLCNAEWMNGGQKLKACPSAGADLSGGYAEVIDPILEGFPSSTPILLTVPAWNGYSSFFLRYPALTVGPNDRFRAVLLCQESAPCDVQFALEYYDSQGKFHSPFLAWDYKNGDAPIEVDANLSALSGQNVDFVLTIRLFHATDSPDQDKGLWVTPHIYRPLP